MTDYLKAIPSGILVDLYIFSSSHGLDYSFFNLQTISIDQLYSSVRGLGSNNDYSA